MTEDIFMTYVTLAVAVFILGLGAKKLFQKYPHLISTSSKYSIKELLFFMMKNKETRNRLLVTIIILIAVRIGYFIPIPTLNADLLRNFFQVISRTSGGIYFSGIFDRVSILSLGILPFISSCIIIQLLSVVIPAIRNTMFEGERGREKLSKYSYILATTLALIQSFFISLWLENPARFQGLDIVTMHGLPFRVITTLTLTGAVLLLLILANLINRYGIGNGIGLIVLSGILVRFFRGAYQLFSSYIGGKFTLFGILILLAIFVGMLYIVFFLTHNRKIIALKARTSRQEFTIPLRTSWVGKVPIGLAQSIYLFPATIASLGATTTMQNFANQLMQNTWINIIVKAILVFIFTYLYAIVIFKPKYLQDLMEKYNFLFKSTNGKEPEKYLDDSISKLLIITALLLIALLNFPAILLNLFKISYLVAAVIGGVNILIMVGVFSDILSQLEFFYEKKKKPNLNFKIAYIAFDEIEATIKSEYLKQRGIDSLVEPLRFTWGMPIRTAVDQYRIYTTQDKIGEARKLIG